MKATFALLANTEVHNLVRKLAWEIHQKYRTGTKHYRLPPHISLKQPFRVPTIDGIASYMAELASSIQPFEVRLSELQVMPTVSAGTEYGISWLDVEESDDLRRLHNRANCELGQRFGGIQADHDGAMYHLHMTVMLGGWPLAVYRKFYNELPDRTKNLRSTARELAIFVYDEPMGPEGEYLGYKLLPIGG